MIRILLADDEGLMLNSMKTIIATNFGDECEVFTAKTGRVAVEIAEEEKPDIALMDIVAAIGTCTDSNYASQYGLPGTFAPTADFGLLKITDRIAQEKNLSLKVGNIVSSDIFYNEDNSVNDRWKKMNVLAVDMEAAALYMNAARCGKKALCLLTISDHLYRHESLTAMQRQNSFQEMMTLALDTAAACEA